MARHVDHDLFDDLAFTSERQGVHRAPRRKGAGWIAFAWAALATFVLTIAGVGTLIVTSDSISLKDFETIFSLPVNTPTPTPKPTAAPTMDPAVIVNVLNATGETGYATAVGDLLAAEGWSVGARSNASSTADATVIYYLTPDLEGAARGVAQALGYGTIELSDKFLESSAGITVILGTDSQL